MEKQTFKIIYEVDFYSGGAILKSHIEEKPESAGDEYFCRLSILKNLVYYNFPYSGMEEYALKEKVLEVLTKYIRENKPKIIETKGRKDNDT